MFRLIFLVSLLPVMLSAQGVPYPRIQVSYDQGLDRAHVMDCEASSMFDTPFALQEGESHDDAVTGRFGLRVGVGTDLGGGLAYGIGLNYLIGMKASALEIGLLFYTGSFEETTEEYHTYHEKTDIFVFAFMANWLLNYQPGRSGFFVVGGIGLGMIAVDWEEWSPTDTSLGPPRPEGGSSQSEDASGGGMIFNVGAGYNFASNLDVRAEVPVLLTFSAPEKASSVIPMFTLSLGYRF